MAAEAGITLPHFFRKAGKKEIEAGCKPVHIILLYRETVKSSNISEFPK